MKRIVSTCLRVLLAVLGLLMLLFGGVGTLVGALAVVDPEGTQHANDADPFGTPPPLIGSLAVTSVFVVVSASGALAMCLAWRGTKAPTSR